MLFRIYPLFLGSIQKRKSDILYNYADDTQMRTAYGCFVLQGGGETILVDTGLPSQERMNRENLPFQRINNAPSLVEALNKQGISPLEVSKIIWTHVHYDHASNIDQFPNAREFFVQRREILAAVDPIPAQKKYYCALAETGRPEWIQAIGRIRLLDGDREILPGCKVLHTPGHTPGSQCVIVETKEGTYALAGDHIPIAEAYERCIPNGILENKDEWYASHSRLRALGAYVLPGHDYQVFQKRVYG